MPLSLATRCIRKVTARSTVSLPSKLGTVAQVVSARSSADMNGSGQVP